MANEIRKIIFFNSPAEVDDYLACNKKCLGKDTMFIAMRPEVRSHLKERGIPSQDTTNYFTTDSHKRTLEKSEIIIDWLRRTANFLDLGMGINRAYKDWFILFTRCLIHYCLWAVEVVLNAIALHNPQVIGASYSGKRAVSSFYIEPEEKYFGYIIKVIAKAKNLKFENIPVKISHNFYPPILRDSNNYVKAVVKFIVKTQNYKFWQKKILKSISFNGRPILFTSKLYQMDKLFAKVQNNFRNKSFYTLDTPVIASFNIPNFFIKLFLKEYSNAIIRQKRSFTNLERSIRAETEIFSYRDISFADIISQKVQDNIANFIVGLYLWTVRIDKFIGKLNPSAIVSNGGRYDDLILAELCNRRKIPTVLISHGSHVCPKNKYEYIEWKENNRLLLEAPFSYLALQSPLSEAYLEAFPTESKTIRTGPLAWGTAINLERSKLLFKKFFGAKYDFKDIKIIVHAGTPKQTKALRLYVYETPDEYIQSLCDLANAVKEIPNVILIIKFRPWEEINVENLKRLVPFSERVVLSVEEPFIDILGLTDLLVSFSSTTIEEALQNRIPVLLYGGGGRYQHVAAYEITSDNSIQPSAVYHVKEARDLECALRKILDLNINSENQRHLFEPFIYAQDIRTSLVDLLKEWSVEKERKLDR